jgi:single-stranded DNA-binding protein
MPPAGAPCASFALAVSELGQDGREHTTLIPCEVWGKKAEAAGELEAGQLVLFEGKLAKRKKGEQWELVVSGFEVTPIVAPLTTLTGSSN